MKAHTTNYHDTFIEIASNSPEYEQLANDGKLKVVKAMRSSR